MVLCVIVIRLFSIFQDETLFGPPARLQQMTGNRTWTSSTGNDSFYDGMKTDSRKGGIYIYNIYLKENKVVLHLYIKLSVQLYTYIS